MELAEARAAVNDMTTINSKASAEKRHLESIIHTLHAEIDEMLHQAKNSEEKAKKAMIDAARLADELRSEQEHSTQQEKAKRTLESQIAELEHRLAEANELGSVQSRTSETYKSFQKAERRIKELQFQQEEDHKNQDRMSELASKLQQKIKTYKKQIEEAEEIAALNLAKFRKAQQEMEEAEERSKLASSQLSFTH
jgi:predicted  nucleic acid-binding Zn-ribbon protein